MPAVGSALNITTVFKDDSGSPVDPDTIAVEVLDSEGDSITGATPQTATRLSVGKYQFTWTPDTEGTFTVVITGSFTSADDIVVQEQFTITKDNPDSTAPALDEDVTLTFSSGYDPLFLDPELVAIYDDQASYVEIAQIINKFSLEVQTLFPNGDHPPVALDYIQAATLCSLSRIHEGVGSSNYSGFTLGDLQVMNTSSTSTKSGTDRGNIISWCELAELLRKELRNAKGGIVSAVKAGSWGSPIPSRGLSRAEYRRRIR